MSFPHEVSSLMESGDESVTLAVTPPSIRKAAFTRAAGAVIGAAVLVAGGYALGRSAGISTHSKAFTFLQEDHEYKHMSEECVGALEALEDNAEETGRKHEAEGHDIECQEEEMVCKATVHEGEMDHPMSKCFPAHKCKVENIRKEVEASLEEAGVSMSYFACGDDIPEAEGEPEEGPGAPEAEGEPEGPEAPEAEGESEGPEAPEAEGEPEGPEGPEAPEAEGEPGPGPGPGAGPGGPDFSPGPQDIGDPAAYDPSSVDGIEEDEW